MAAFVEGWAVVVAFTVELFPFVGCVVELVGFVLVGFVLVGFEVGGVDDVDGGFVVLVGVGVVSGPCVGGVVVWGGLVVGVCVVGGAVVGTELVGGDVLSL